MSNPASMAPPASLFKGRLLAFAAIILVSANLRSAVTSLTPLLDRLGHLFDFGSTMTGVLGMMPTAAFALLGLSTPRLIRWLGLERTAALTMLLATAGLLLRASADSVGTLLAGSAVALAGMGIGNVVVPPLVKRYFADRVGTLSTLYITVLQAGTMVPALLAVPVADRFDWRISLGMWSLLSLAALLPWLMLARRTPRPQGAAATTVAHAPGRVWKTSLGWGMALMFGMTSLGTYSLFTWLPKVMVEAGASESFGGVMVAVYSAIGLLPSLLVPALAVRMRNPFPIAMLVFGLNAIAFAGLLWAPMQAPWLWAVIAGLGPSTFPLGLTLINLRTRTPAGSAALSGFMQGVGYSLASLGPLLFGWLHGFSGGWAWSFAFLMLCSLVLLIAAWFACKPQQLEDHWA
ncbi:MAG: MFS transporter [Stenotrophomonas nitritireducens]|uniref:CynX/NimT family MFS transporter n=1 Tax=Stenotrophomonas nitritireducens TaxID=83617 RepID=UPI001ACFA011|nr:MFS transporter [Stenotrophomonas nitritireducens]MBN8769383.1 MFS transporter [Stenotrophomonas sp.]MBN8793378.1 MFS transporter [Stenotrophomonas nitritireducens]